MKKQNLIVYKDRNDYIIQKVEITESFSNLTDAIRVVVENSRYVEVKVRFLARENALCKREADEIKRLLNLRKVKSIL